MSLSWRIVKQEQLPSSLGRNGLVENVAVDIAKVVDNQIDVGSDSSSDNELLEEVVRPPAVSVCPIGDGS